MLIEPIEASNYLGKLSQVTFTCHTQIDVGIGKLAKTYLVDLYSHSLLTTHLLRYTHYCRVVTYI